MKNGNQSIQDQEFMERIMRGGQTPNRINFKSIPGGGFYIYRGKLDELTALKITYNESKKHWETFDPEDEDPNVPVCINKSLQPCVHYCISIL